MTVATVRAPCRGHFEPVGSKEKRLRRELTLIAIYHLHLKIITRGDGKSAVAAAAYRSGSKLHSEYDGGDHDYTRKGGVVHTEILLPTNAPQEFSDRNTLWNAVEKSERYKNAQLAREVEVALPVELTQEQNIALVRKYVQENFVDKGMIADACIHAPDRETPNPHAHIMLTMRPLNEDKTWGAKLRTVGKKTVYISDWNDRGKAEVWRAAWADAVNAELKKHGHAERIDHRSYERQGVEQIPTVHLGVAVTQMERRGIVTDRGNVNREIEFSNSQIRQLRARANRVKVWLDENKANTPPPLYDVFMEITNAPTGNTQYDKLKHVKLMAKTLMFIQQNSIADLISLADKVGEIQRGCTDAYERKKKVERRVTTLDKHATQCKNFTANRGVKLEYDKIHATAEAAEKSTGLFAKSKAEKARKAAQDFYYDHTPEIETYKAAEKYLKDVLQKRFDPKQIAAQAKKWSGERETCKQELGGINAEYNVYKREVESAEEIKRFAVKLMFPDDAPQQQKQKSKSKGIEI
ncbi:hypothetical protein FACS1894208_06590 [Clostridia bacterium]|nr:hypothetical protein FACS1894208_06590 [Clostridia bacterium]